MKLTNLRKIGTSLGVIIPAGDLAKLGLQEGDQVVLAISGDDLLMRRANQKIAKTAPMMDGLFAKHDETLRQLKDRT